MKSIADTMASESILWY